MTKYAVLCSCDSEPAPRIIAWIDDERPTGRITIKSNHAFRATQLADGRITYSIRCRACRRWVPWSEATAGDVIDRIKLARDILEVRLIPVFEPPDFDDAQFVPYDELCRIAAEQSLVDPDGAVVPNVAHFESRHVIPFQALCQIVTKLRDT